VAERAGYRMIESGASSRTHDPSKPETRGRKLKVTSEQVREADHLVQDNDLQLEGKRLTWGQVAMEVRAEVVGRTMHRTLQLALDYGLTILTEGVNPVVE
jgi:hypothetical protein